MGGRAGKGDAILRRRDPGSEAGRWVCLLMVGMSKFKMCKSAQSSSAPREVVRSNEDERGPNRGSWKAPHTLPISPPCLQDQAAYHCLKCSNPHFSGQATFSIRSFGNDTDAFPVRPHHTKPQCFMLTPTMSPAKPIKALIFAQPCSRTYWGCPMPGQGPGCRPRGSGLASGVTGRPRRP